MFAAITEVRVLQQQILSPQRYNSRRIERLTASSEHLVWEVQQQVSVPIVDREIEDSFPLVLSLGRFSKKRLPEMSAFDSGGNHLPLLPREERTRYIALVLLAQKEIVSAADQEDQLVPAFSEAVKLVAQIVGASDERFDELFRKLEALVADGSSAISQLLGGSWSELSDHLQNLRDQTHILCRIDARQGDEIFLIHKYVDEMLELSDLRDVSPDIHDGVPAGEGSTVIRLASWVSRRLGVRNREALYRLAQGFCLYPTTVSNLQYDADHCRSFYLLVTPPVGMQTDLLYWEQRKQSGAGYLPVEASQSCVSHDSSLGRMGRHGRVFADVRADVGVFSVPIMLLLVQAFMVFVLARPNVVRSEQATSLLSLGAVFPAAVVAWIAQTRPGLRTASARLLRMSLYLAASAASFSGLLALIDLEDLNLVSVLSKEVLGYLVTAGLVGLALMLLVARSLDPSQGSSVERKDHLSFEDVQTGRTLMLTQGLAWLAVVFLVAVAIPWSATAAAALRQWL